MFRLTLRGLTARKLRAALTALAVFFGVAMIAGTLMLTDTINNSFDDIFSSANRNVDVTVKPREAVEDTRGAEPPAFPAGLLAKVKAVDGVAEAAGSIFDPSIAILNDKGERIGPMGPPHFAASTVPPRFNPWTYEKGGPPTNAGQVAVDKFTAKREHYRLGQQIRIAGTVPAKRYTITGIGRFGSDVPLGGAHIALLTLPEVQRLTGKEGKFDEILAGGDSTVSNSELKRRVASALPPAVKVRTGTETAKAEADDVKSGFSFLSTALFVFAGVALFVGGFLIFNTFSITVSQRIQEFGMLRTLGASGRQVLWTVLLEAVIIGLIASIAGIVGGIGFVAMITGLFKAIGFELPTSELILSSKTVIVALVVGLVSTTVASTVPAVRATRVTPLDALREQGLRPRSPGRRRTVIALVLFGLGALLLGWGLFGSSSAGASFTAFGPGLILLFIGVAMLSNRVVRPIAGVVGWPIEKLRGVTGLLARENTLRNPSRTTTTAAALMIGLALVTFVATFAAALNKSFENALDKAFLGDLVLVNTDGQSRIPTKVARQVSKVPGVETASPLASGDAKVKGVSSTQTVGAIDPATITQVAKFEWMKGSNATVQSLGPNDAIAESDWAKDNGVGVDDQVRVTTPTGKITTYTVRGTARDKAGLVLETFAIPRATLARDFAVNQDDVTLVSFDPGANFDATRARVDQALTAAFPNVESKSQRQLKDDQRKQINKLLVLIYALLALSVVISLFGVVNTLILTIHERTREIGMLRAIGTSRAQVRRMIRYESVITAMIGALIGAAVGLLLAIVAVKALADEGFVLSIPYPLLVIMLMLAAVAGVAAAIAPARRASRINVIEALQYE
jgi:putative ABC transport system permease protein